MRAVGNASPGFLFPLEVRDLLARSLKLAGVVGSELTER
jgi:hypothetical protein